MGHHTTWKFKVQNIGILEEIDSFYFIFFKNALRKRCQKIWAGPSPPPSFGQNSVFIRKTSLSVFVCVSVFVFWLLCFVQVEADYGGAHPLLATTWPTAWRNFQPAQGKSPTQENTIRKHDTNRKSQTQESNPRKHDTNTTNGVTSTQLVITTLQKF